MTYYGVSLSSGSLGGDIHLVFFLTSAVAVPANFAATYLVDRFGRIKTTIITLVLSALAMISASLFSLGDISTVKTVVRVVLSMFGKFLMTIAFDAAYLITYEIFPTSLRNVAMGISSASARVGSFSASYIIYLKDFNPILPYMIFGVVCTVCAVSCILLPETNKTATKETLGNVNKQPFGDPGIEFQKLAKDEMRLMS